MFTIGSDPEFLIFDDISNKKSFVSALDVLGRGTLNNRIGIDGHSSTGEIRAKEGNSPEEHFNNIYGCIKELSGLASNYEIAGGSGIKGEPIGGHIHFGIKNDVKIKIIVKMLDITSLFLLPVEQKSNNIIRRCKHNYGHLGNWRNQNWGFEYRTPSSWLVSPFIAKSFLCLYYTVANEGYYNNYLKKNTNFNDLISFIDEHDLNTAYNFGKNDAYWHMYQKFKKAVMSCSSYKQYAPYINSLLSLIEVGKSWNERNDILISWGVKTESLFGKLMFSKDDYIEKIKELINQKSKYKIYVYGLKKSREKNEITDITTNNANLFHNIQNINEKLNLNLTVEHRGIRTENNINDIGISYWLREEKPELVSIILNAVIKKSNMKK